MFDNMGMKEWPNANQCFPGNRNYILDLCSATKFVELLITYHVFSIVSNSLFRISFIQKHKAWKTGWPLAHCEAKFSRISTSSCSILETDKLIGFRRSVGWIHHFAQLKTKSICQAFLCVHQTNGFDNFNMPRRKAINCSQCITETVELMARSCQGFFSQSETCLSFPCAAVVAIPGWWKCHPVEGVVQWQWCHMFFVDPNARPDLNIWWFNDNKCLTYVIFITCLVQSRKNILVMPVRIFAIASLSQHELIHVPVSLGHQIPLLPCIETDTGHRVL